MKTHILTALLITLFYPAMISGVQAQGMHLAPGNTGLGGGGGAYMSGYHANFINPANLMLDQRNTRLTIGILGGLSTSAGGSLVNLSLYNDHFTTGQVIDTQKAMDISDDWFGSGSDASARMGFNLNVVPLGVSYRRDDMAFGTALRIRTMSTTNMSKGLFQLALAGPNAEVFADPKKVDLNTEMFAVAEWSFGYAMEVWNNQIEFGPGAQRVFAGAAPKILFGLGYTGIGLDSRLQITGGGEDSRIIHEFDYYLKTIGNLTEDLDRYYQERRVQNNKDAQIGDFVDGDSFSDLGGVQGVGLGLDIGGTFEWYMQDVSLPVIGSGPQILRASFSITDLGSVNFSGNAGEFRAMHTFDWDGLDVDYDHIDENHDGEFSNYFEYVMEDSIASDIYGNFSPQDISSHRVGLNPMFNLGGSLTMGDLGVMLDIGKGFNNRGVNSKRFYTALGSEYYPINAIPLRIGLRMGGYSGVSYAFGTGVNLKNFEFTLSMLSTASSKRGGANLTGAWSGIVMHF